MALAVPCSGDIQAQHCHSARHLSLGTPGRRCHPAQHWGHAGIPVTPPRTAHCPRDTQVPLKPRVALSPALGIPSYPCHPAWHRLLCPPARLQHRSPSAPGMPGTAPGAAGPLPAAPSPCSPDQPLLSPRCPRRVPAVARAWHPRPSLAPLPAAAGLRQRGARAVSVADLGRGADRGQPSAVAPRAPWVLMLPLWRGFWGCQHPPGCHMPGSALAPSQEEKEQSTDVPAPGNPRS